MAVRPTTLRFRLMLLVVTAVLPIFGLVIYQAACEQRRKARESREEVVRLASLAAGSISQAMEGARQMLVALAWTEPVRTMDIPATNRLFADVLRHSGNYLNLGLVRADGLIVASGLPLGGPVSIEDRLWFRQMLDTGNLSVSEYLVGRISGKPAVNLGYPLYAPPGEPFPGAVYASLDLRVLQKCISWIRLPKDGSILVLDKKGLCLACSPCSKRTRTFSHPELVAAKGEGPGFMAAPVAGIDGILRDYYCAALPEIDGVRVAVGISKAAAVAESRAEFRRNLVILVLWTAVSLAGAWVVGRASVLRHVNHLIQTARRLAQRDWNATAAMSGGASEIRQLADTFDAMAGALRLQNEELETQVRQRTAELRAANASLTDALAQVKTLNGLLPICSGCKKIRDDRGYWSQIELYISAHSDARFSHGLCPECAKKYYPELDWEGGETPPEPGEAHNGLPERKMHRERHR